MIGTTDFCVMHGTMPGEDDQRTLALAGAVGIGHVRAHLRDPHPPVWVERDVNGVLDHRLGRGTSGLIAFGKTAPARAALSRRCPVGARLYARGDGPRPAR